MKLFVALGPGDIVAAHRAQMAGEVSAETSITFSEQLCEYCREQDIEVLALSYHPREDSLRDGHLYLENRPRRWEGASGIRHHLSKIFYAINLAIRARRFGADLAIIDSGTAHYFALVAFKFFGVPVAVNFHNTLWPNGFEPKHLILRTIGMLDAWFFSRIAVGTIGVSQECGRQAQQLAGRPLPFFEYRCQFRDSGFQLKQNRDRRPFRVIFVGRAERNKGVLDIAEIAEGLRNQPNTPILFEVCGEGGALSQLKTLVENKRLQDIVHVHGRLSRAALFQLYARANAVIVPTRSDFCEGLPAVCAEAALSGLPIITSRLSNAIPTLGSVLMEVEPEDIAGYIRAIRKLAGDHALYDRLRDACPSVSRQFLDRSQSYPAAIDLLVSRLFPGWKPLTSYEPLFARIT